MVMKDINTLSIDPDLQISSSNDMIIFADETAFSTPSKSHELFEISQALKAPFWDSVL
jgi:hypothetical protein